MSTINIFYSYSNADQHLCDELFKHLQPLIHSNIINNWYSRQVLPGARWSEAIQSSLADSDIALFLVSSDFLSSSEIFNNEVKLAIRQHEAGKTIIIPVMLRECMIEYTELGKFQALPANNKPVMSREWASRDEAYVKIVEGISRYVHEIKLKKKIIQEDKEAWDKAIAKDTIEAYQEYLRDNSNTAKFYLQEALKKISQSINDYSLSLEYFSLAYEMEKRERLYIGQELHDNIGQMLSVLRLYLRSPEIKLDEANMEVVGDLLDKIILLSGNLAKSTNLGQYHEFTLKDELSSLKHMLANIGGKHINLQFDNIDKSADNDTGINIFRIVQEMISNNINHANSSKMTIYVGKKDDVLSVNMKQAEIDPEKIEFLSSDYGLYSIKARVKSLKGTIMVDMTTGLEINIDIPCHS